MNKAEVLCPGSPVFLGAKRLTFYTLIKGEVVQDKLQNLVHLISDSCYLSVQSSLSICVWFWCRFTHPDKSPQKLLHTDRSPETLPTCTAVVAPTQWWSVGAGA